MFSNLAPAEAVTKAPTPVKNNLSILKRVNSGELSPAEGIAILEKVCNGHHEQTSTWKKLIKRV